ncbi:MAG: hypothetical protein K8U57_17535 [Planctomycetes bacterium]|nr:hypothetical protein [Planctomycetota bacterium]
MNDESRTEECPPPGVPPFIVHRSSFIVTHSIRLRGAWITTTDNSRTCHSRNFGWPKPLDVGDQLWLVCSHIPGQADVLLNGDPIVVGVAAGAFAVEITKVVHPRNTVVFAVEAAESLGDVTLEVRSPLG